MGIILNPKITLASLRKLLGYPQSLCIRSSVVFPNQKCKCEVEGAAFEELDIVKIIANTYQDDGLNPGEQGTIVLFTITMAKQPTKLNLITGRKNCR